ncbi:hypothetical protein AAE478_010244 [Parahypoxylon ruwenzoriense]
MVQSSTGGYDGSMLNGLNILPSYTDYFRLTPATTGLNTASVFIGCTVGTLVSGTLTDRLGRRPAVFWASVATLIGIILQTAAQNTAMFVIGRIILGFGSANSGVSSGVYLSETFPSRWRAWGVGLLNDFYYVGALIAAGVTLGTGQWQSTIRPESPRWLVHEGHFEYARISVAQTNSNGDVLNPVAVAIYKEILDTLEWEKKEGRTTSIKEIVKTPTLRKRFLIAMSTGPFSCIAGNIIASYYLGAELTTAGITNSNDQLKANVVLNVWCLACALAGTNLAAQWGRKPTALVSEILLVICLFIIGGLSKMYADNPDNASSSLVYGNVAVMFLFQGFYSVAWTPLLYIYPPEVLSVSTGIHPFFRSALFLFQLYVGEQMRIANVLQYSIRANGLAASTLGLNLLACVFVFIMPIGLHNIGWRMYMVNGSWDIVIAAIIAFFWVETKGKTLEEIDAIFEGEKHSSVPSVEQVRLGKATIDVRAINQQLNTDIEGRGLAASAV